MIELETLLYGNPSWSEVVDFFKKGQFCDEPYMVAAIKRWLITSDDRKKMLDADLSIEDLLNGRYLCDLKLPSELKQDWNDKLGFSFFC